MAAPKAAALPLGDSPSRRGRAAESNRDPARPVLPWKLPDRGSYFPMNESAIAGGVFRLIVEQARDLAIFVLDERGLIELWNIGAERTFGWTSDEILGRSFEILFLPDDRRLGIPGKELERARRTGRSDNTRWHIRKDGRMVFVDGVNTRLAEGGFSKFARDITDRYRSEQRLA